jgi:hypothetical protein
LPSLAHKTIVYASSSAFGSIAIRRKKFCAVSNIVEMVFASSGKFRARTRQTAAQQIFLAEAAAALASFHTQKLQYRASMKLARYCSYGAGFLELRVFTFTGRAPGRHRRP